MNVKVVVESTVKPPHIQVDLSIRDAKLISSLHTNMTNILIEDLRKSLKFVDKYEYEMIHKE